MRKASLIYNPLAGTINLGSAVRVIADYWRENGWQVQVEPTEYAGHARQLARKAAESEYELVLAAGGDGTLGEIAGGLVESQTIMAPLPAGTGNSFTKELDLSKGGLFPRRSLLAACEKLIAGRVQRIDLGCYNGNEHWLLWASVGVDAFVVARIEPRSRLARRLGSLGYLGLGTPFLPRFPGMRARVTVDGQEFSGDYLMVTVSNCRRYAGGKYLLSPSAQLDDGFFEIWVFRGRFGWGIFRILAQIARGRHLDHPDSFMVRGREVFIETESPMPFHRDGDPAGATPLHCWVKPGALRLLVPETLPSGLFSRPGEPFG